MQNITIVKIEIKLLIKFMGNVILGILNMDEKGAIY